MSASRPAWCDLWRSSRPPSARLMSPMTSRGEPGNALLDGLHGGGDEADGLHRAEGVARIAHGPERALGHGHGVEEQPAVGGADGERAQGPGSATTKRRRLSRSVAAEGSQTSAGASRAAREGHSRAARSPVERSPRRKGSRPARRPPARGRPRPIPRDREPRPARPIRRTLRARELGRSDCGLGRQGCFRRGPEHRRLDDRRGVVAAAGGSWASAGVASRPRRLAQARVRQAREHRCPTMGGPIVPEPGGFGATCSGETRG